MFILLLSLFQMSAAHLKQFLYVVVDTIYYTNKRAPMAPAATNMWTTS